MSTFMIPGFEAKRIVEVEISEPLPAIDPYDAERDRTYRQALVAVRLHTHPIGMLSIELPTEGIAPEKLADVVWDALEAEIIQHLVADGLEEIEGLPADGLPTVTDPACLTERRAVLADAPRVSVIIATHDRPESLARTLESLQTLEYPNYEVIVVDNAPSTDATERLIRDRFASPQVRYVREGRQGLSWARNRGLLEAEGEIVAFTDDDIVVDRHWVTVLVEGFRAADNVGCVTGLVLPAEFDTPTQQLFEQYASFSLGFDTRIYDLNGHRPPNPGFPYLAGMLGAGCSMAFRSDVIRSLGGFDPALGSGSAAGSGEDLRATFEVIHRGIRTVYQPSALVYHRHRSDRDSLERQVYTYGTGFISYLISVFVAHPALVLDVAGKLPVYMSRFIVSKRLETLSREGYYPPELRNLELRGMLLGPVQYVRSRVRSRRIIREFGSSEVGPRDTSSATLVPGFEAKRIVEVEISEPLPAIDPYDAERERTYRQALVVVRLHTHPIGMLSIELPTEGIAPEKLADVVWDALEAEIIQHLVADGLEEIEGLPADGLPTVTDPACLTERRAVLADAPRVSVIIATHDRPESLVRTLESLQTLEYPNYEVIVVDNAPSTDATEHLICDRFASPCVRYVREGRQGQAWAHNRGVARATGEILAVTDDDVTVDRHWVSALVEGFRAADNVGCVTGLGLPTELDTPTQQLFEQYGGFRKGFQRRVFDARAHRPTDPTFPYSAGTYGAGCNMAFRAGVLRSIGWFDPVLGVGTPTGGGEDIRAFLDVILAGKQIVYQPSALVYHCHRRDMRSLERQLYANGLGLVAYMISSFRDRPLLALDFAGKAFHSWRHLRHKKGMTTLSGEIAFPQHLRNLELRGMLLGPLAYIRGVLHYRRLVRRFGPLSIDEP